MFSFAARSCKAWSLCLYVVAAVLQAAACTLAPEPPETPSDVLQLSASYDQPTASLDQLTAERLFGASVPNYTELKTLAGLSFVRGVIAEALQTEPIDETALALDVQGSLAVHAECPGWGDGMSGRTDAASGYVDLVIGVDDSRVQRAFAGSVTACRFTANLAGERAQVEASMELEVDLGRSLTLGDPVPPILLSASRLTAALSVELSSELADEPWAALANALAPDGLELDLDSADRQLSLRIAQDDLLETLVDLDAFDLGTQGTIVLGMRDDGSFNLRGRDSTYDCGSDGSVACVRSSD